MNVVLFYLFAWIIVLPIPRVPLPMSDEMFLALQRFQKIEQEERLMNQWIKDTIWLVFRVPLMHQKQAKLVATRTVECKGNK
jgi:hypothetical protein